MSAADERIDLQEGVTFKQIVWDQTALKPFPGASQARAGARLQGYLVFGLFVFAVIPLSWLAVARTWGAIPAPGIVSANLFAYGIDFQGSLLPPPPDGAQPGEGSAFRRLCAESFPRLLLVYPAAQTFWCLVLSALAGSLGLHARGPGRSLPSP